MRTDRYLLVLAVVTSLALFLSTLFLSLAISGIHDRIDRHDRFLCGWILYEDGSFFPAGQRQRDECLEERGLK